MVEAIVYTHTGLKKGKKVLPSIFSAKVNLNGLSQAIRVYEVNKHPNLSRVKTRGEMSISTRKIYRQKGTGNARHGAKSAPIFIGGGIAHGPKGIKRQVRLSKRLAKNALSMALSLKLKRNEIVLVEGLEKLIKTKDANTLLVKILGDIKLKRGTFIVPSDLKEESKRAFRNLKTAKNTSFENLNAYDVFYGGALIFDSRIFNKKEDKPTGVSKKKN